MFAMTRLSLQIAFVVGAAFAALLALAAFSSTANATHSWSTFHWGRPGSSFTLQLDDNLTTTAWKTHLVTASSSGSYNDWTDSSVLDTTIAKSTNTKQCKATSGRVEVCNAKYGPTGWIGLASVWTSGGHIVQGTAKMNDSYYMSNWTKQQVMCQEVGHTFGLGHQDESGSSAFDSCMTYDKATETADQWPDSHDYAQLECIYVTVSTEPKCAGHNDSTTTVGSTSAASKLPPAALAVDTADPRQRGQLVHRSPNGRVEIYERDFGQGHKVITRVIRVDEETPPLDERTTGPGGGVPHRHDSHDH